MTGIQVYATITDAKEDKIDYIYDQVIIWNQENMQATCAACEWRLESKVKSIKEENIVGSYDLKNQNEIGEWLINLCHNEFFILNTVFK